MKRKILLGFAVLIMLIAALVGGYFYGMSQRADEVEALKSDRQAAESSYAKSLEAVNNERNRVLNDYEAACFEYQELYAAYDLLYSQRGAGFERYLSPDAARGNEESCYR